MKPHHHNRFMAPFPGPSGWAGAGRELLDFMVQRKVNWGRHTDHPAGRHSIRTNESPPPPSPHIFYRPDALPASQPTASKHWRQTKLSNMVIIPLDSPCSDRWVWIWRTTTRTKQPISLNSQQHYTWCRQGKSAATYGQRAAATATVWRIGGKFTRTGLCCVRKLCIMSPGSIDWYQ